MPHQVTSPVGNTLTNHGKRSIVRAICGIPLSPYPLALDSSAKIEVIDTTLSRLTPPIHQYSGWEVDAGFPTQPQPNQAYYEFTFPDGEVLGQWDSIYLLAQESSSEWMGMTRFQGFYDTWGEKTPGEVWTVEYTFIMTAEGSEVIL